MGLYIYPW